MTSANLSAPSTESAESRTRRIGWRVLWTLLGIALFVWVIRDLDVRELGELIQRVGLYLPLLLAPRVLGSLLHAAAWGELLRGMEQRVAVRSLWRVLVAADVARLVAPFGPIAAESISLYALKTEQGISLAAGALSLALKKAWLLISHGLWLALVLLVGHGMLMRLGQTTQLGAWPVWLIAAFALMLVTAGGLMLLALASPKVRQWAKRLAGALPFQALARWAAAASDSPALTKTKPRQHLAAFSLLFAQWGVEALEGLVLLWLLGLDPSVLSALLLELAGSVVKSLAFAVPAGAGFQDAGFAWLVGGMSGAGATAAGAAFALGKRLREALFVLGGSWLVGFRRGPRRPISNQASDPGSGSDPSN